MLERDTGRPRGFGFITFSDRRGMEDAIREMHGTEIGERAISVNKAQPKLGGDEADHGYGGGGGDRYGGDNRSMGQSDECFKCGRSGHWARDCPSAGGGGARGGGRQFSSRPRLSGGRVDRYAERERYIEDRYDGGRFGDRDRYDSRDSSKYGGSRSRYSDERYAPSGGDRFVGDRYGVLERYPAPPPLPPPQSGYGRERDYDRDVGPRRSSDRYGGGGAARYEGRSYKDRAGPYDRPRRGGGRPSSFDY